MLPARAGHMEPGLGRERYRFGIFDFDVAALELRKKGHVVKVRPQALKLLALILARPGDLVSRDEIRQALWGGDTFVDFDQGVNHCIKQLRFALGDDAESPRYVETLPRRGYRFIAPVEAVADDRPGRSGTDIAQAVEREPPVDPTGPPAAPLPTEGHRGRRAVYLMGSGIAVIAVAFLIGQSGRRPAEARPDAPVVLEVARFASSPDPAVGLGLAHEIARRLGSQHAVSVRPVRVPGSSPDAASGSGEGGVGSRLLVEGEIQQTDDVIAVSARLMDARAGTVTWSQRFTVRADELFSVEDVIAERVVGALRLRIAAPEQERLRRRYTSNAPAYEQYLRGRASMVEYTPDGTRRATAAFEQALKEDPGFTLARAGLAAAYADMYLRFAPAGDPDRWAERAEAEARAALDLDPDLAEAHLARAAVARKREFDWETAIAASRRALVLNPSLDQAHFFIAAAYYHLGYMEESLLEMERGRRLDGPDVVEPLRIEALVALFSGRFAPAVAQLEEVSRRSSQPIGDTYLALAHYYTGNADRAQRMLESLASHASASTAARAGAALAGVLAARGEAHAARRRVADVLAREYRDHHVAYGLGAAYAQLGDAPRAVQWLRTSTDTGFPCVIWFERDPLLDPLRRAAPFAELLAHAKRLRDASRGQAP